MSELFDSLRRQAGSTPPRGAASPSSAAGAVLATLGPLPRRRRIGPARPWRLVALLAALAIAWYGWAK